MTSFALPALSNDAGLSSYLSQIHNFPMLSEHEEYTLAKRWREDEDIDAAHQLVTSHLRLAAKIALKYRGYGLPATDLISEGNVGLMRAVKKFDPDVGVRFSTYAMWWIKASVTEFVLKSWSMVKLSSQETQKKLFFSLNRAKKLLGLPDNSELDDAAAAKLSDRFGMPVETITDFNHRVSVRDLSLNQKVGDTPDAPEHLDFLADDRSSAEDNVAEASEFAWRQELLIGALDTLSPRDREIFEARRLAENPKTLEELGRHYGISRERVRQLEDRAFKKVRSAMVAEIEDRAAQEVSPKQPKQIVGG